MKELEPQLNKKDNMQLWVTIFLWVLCVALLFAYIWKTAKTKTINDQRLEIVTLAQKSMSWSLKIRDAYQKWVEDYNQRIRIIQKCINNNSHTWTLVECNLDFKK